MYKSKINISIIDRIDNSSGKPLDRHLFNRLRDNPLIIFGLGRFHTPVLCCCGSPAIHLSLALLFVLFIVLGLSTFVDVDRLDLGNRALAEVVGKEFIVKRSRHQNQFELQSFRSLLRQQVFHDNEAEVDVEIPLVNLVHYQVRVASQGLRVVD